MTAVPQVRRLWGVIRTGSAGRKVLDISACEPDTTDMEGALLLTGMLAGDGIRLSLDIVGAPLEDPAVKALQSAKLLGIITLTQTATVALAAGLRTIAVTVPLAMGMKAGDLVLAIPTTRLVGYAVHDAVAVSATTVSVTMTAPLLAIGQKYELPCKLVRLSI